MPPGGRGGLKVWHSKCVMICMCSKTGHFIKPLNAGSIASCLSGVGRCYHESMVSPLVGHHEGMVSPSW